MAEKVERQPTRPELVSDLIPRVRLARERGDSQTDILFRALRWVGARGLTTQEMRDAKITQNPGQRILELKARGHVFRREEFWYGRSKYVHWTWLGEQADQTPQPTEADQGGTEAEVVPLFQPTPEIRRSSHYYDGDAA